MHSEDPLRYKDHQQQYKSSDHQVLTESIDVNQEFVRHTNVF